MSESLRVPKTGNNGFHSNGNDEMVNDNEVADEMKYEALCASGDCSSMPAKQKMQIKVRSQLRAVTINAFFFKISDCPV